MRRLFHLNLRVNISAEEASLIQDYLRGTEKMHGEIGHMLEQKAQEIVDALAAKATMYADRKGSL